LWVGATEPMSRETARLVADSQKIELRLAAAATAAPVDATPRQQLEAFAKHFPGEKSIASALARLHALAKKRGVRIEQAEFKLSNEAGEPLARYTVVLPVKAEYRALRHFGRDAMRELPGLAIEEVSLRRGDAKQPLLESQLRLVLFLNKAS
jgi:Tfp pilus assembly protein PilO